MALEKLLHMDRRIIFGLMAVAVGLPLAMGWEMQPGENPRTTDLYNYIEGLPADDVIVIVLDYGPASMPELNPMASALTRHALSRDLRVMMLTLNPEAPILADEILREVGDDLGKESGVDYVNLGFKPGYTAVVLGMATDIGEVFGSDFDGRPYGSLEVTRGVRNYNDIALLVDLASSDTPLMWIQFAYIRYQQTVACGVTAVMAQDYYPYLQSRQLIGLLNGMKGAAEYEKLVGAPGDGMRGMAAQSGGQFLIIGLVIFGNIIFIITRRKSRQ